MRRFWMGSYEARRAQMAELPALPGWKIRSYDEIQRIGHDIWSAHSDVSAYERDHTDAETVRGFSVTAGKLVDFAVDMSGADYSKWRETLICPETGLCNRFRATFHLFMQESQPGKGARIFMPEQTTGLYRYMRSRFSRLIGSEYIPSLRGGRKTKDGIRSEDITKLSFTSNQFDAILALDVLEHVPDYTSALRDCARVLKPGGHIYITVPFTYRAETVVRAKILPDGSVEHILDPEYHDDPSSDVGVLCYYHFGYDLLNDIRHAGFTDTYVFLFSSIEFGYLGTMQAIFVGVK